MARSQLQQSARKWATAVNTNLDLKYNGKETVWHHDQRRYREYG